MDTHTQVLRLWHPDGVEHHVAVIFGSNTFEAHLWAFYVTGSAAAEEEKIVEWSASYEPPNPFDKGSARLGDGRIDLLVTSLRGMGLGALLMQPLVAWIKSHPASVPVAPISLAADDAVSERERDIRNGFYEKLGFRFRFADMNRTWGESCPMLSSELLVPAFRLSRGWKVEVIEGDGEIFCFTPHAEEQPDRK